MTGTAGLNWAARKCGVSYLKALNIFMNFWKCAPVMALLIQTAHTADSLPRKSKSLPRVATASQASVFFLVSLLFLVSIPDRGLSFPRAISIARPRRRPC